MKKIFIIANWKANMSKSQTEEWFQKLLVIGDALFVEKEVVLCPSFSLLSVCKEKIMQLSMRLQLGSQDISMFDKGAYTGEMPGELLKDFVRYVIIGHSERRRYFHETEEVIVKKNEQAIKHKIVPIICVSELGQIKNLKSLILGHKSIIAYEPAGAISTDGGQPDSPEDANSFAEEIKEILEDTIVLYGGSVTSENVNDFTSQEHINGVLVGGASLDPNEFYKIIQKA